MKIIKTGFKLNDQEDKQAGSYPDRQANNIDSSITLVTQQIPPGGFNVISYHDVLNSKT
jgi:hypothetical protein